MVTGAASEIGAVQLRMTDPACDVAASPVGAASAPVGVPKVTAYDPAVPPTTAATRIK